MSKTTLTRQDIADILYSCGVAKIQDKYLYSEKPNMQITCPIHGESTPSMGVNVDTLQTHCFACHFKGNLTWLVYNARKDDFNCDEDKCCGIRPPKAQLEQAIKEKQSPTKVYDNIMNGIPMKLPEWEGYWVSPNGQDILMYCKDGEVLDIRETKDTKYTLDHIFKRFDWVVAE